MSDLVWLQTKDEAEWDRFVRNDAQGWVCHLSAWRHILERSFPHMCGRYLVRRAGDNGPIEAGLPVYEVRSALLGNRLVSVPFATLSDPLAVRAEESVRWLEPVLALQKERKLRGLEIRTWRSHCLANAGLAETRYYRHHVLPLDRPPEELRKGFQRTALRQLLNKADRSNLTVRRGAREEDIRVFYLLFMRSRRRLGLPPCPYPFFAALWNTLQPLDCCALTLTYLGEKPVGAVLALKMGGVYSLEFSGEDESARDLGVGPFTYWSALQSAYAEGSKLFSFGRTAVSNRGLLEFKSRWGASMEDLPIYFHPATAAGAPPKEMTSHYRLARLFCQCVPEPVYRWLGRFFYSHMG